MINSKVVHVKNIRSKMIPYIISWVFFYTWMVMFFTWWVGNFKSSTIFSSNQLFIIYSLFLIFISIIIFFVKPVRFKKYYIVGSVFSLLILIINIFKIKYIIYILPFFIALAYVGLLQIFIYIMNNTEKLYSLIFSNFLLISIVIHQDIKYLNISNNYYFMLILLFLSLLPSVKFNKKDYLNEEKEYAKTAPKISRVLYISLFINCIFLVFCRGIGRGFILLANDMYSFNLEIYYYLGGLVGCILLFLLISYVKKCNVLSWNITFCSFVLAAFLYMWPSSEFIKNMFAFVLGVGIMMGINNMYYMLGIISKKYWNYTYIRFNILVIDLIGCGLGTLLGNYIYNNGDNTIIIKLLTLSVFVVIILLIFSPILANTFFRDKWDEDSTKAVIDNLNRRKFDKYNLTSKEIEVSNYLINNYTVRQIAAYMGVSENTIKFHKKQIFKKTCINSKEELIKILK